MNLNIKPKYLVIIPVLIYISTLPYKFSGNGLPYLYDFFDGLGLDSNLTMVGIGIQELLVSIGLLSGKLRHYASLASIGIMFGAISTHVYLGQFDVVFVEALIVMTVSIITAIKTRKT